MRGILPGRPQSKLQAVAHGIWEDILIVVYISGNALIILDRPDHIVQTIYIDEEAELVAIALDEATGKLAVCSSKHVYIYRPYGQDEGAVKWSRQGSVSMLNPDDSINTLSWGMPDELLAGSTFLTLFNTHSELEQSWTRQLASPVKFANFSPDAEFIASTGKYDRLLKVWRRTSFGSVDQTFDYFYLAHPTTLTGLHWRQPFHREQSASNVLYTICADDKVRLWVPGDHHGIHGMYMWAEVNLQESIMTQHIPQEQRSKKRFAFFIDSKHFTHAAERALQQASTEEKDHGIALHHLIEVTNRNPEICVVTDDRGNISAWAFENVGAQVKKITDVFNIAHADGLHLHFATDVLDSERNTQFYAFMGGKLASDFTMLLHHFDGRIEWLEARVDYLFDPSPREHRMERKAIWTGHTQAIEKINRTASGQAIVSRTIADECIVWLQKPSEQGFALQRKSSMKITDRIRHMALLQEGDFIVFLHHEKVSLWDTRGQKAKLVTQCSYEVKGEPLCLLLVPETEADCRRVHVATISSEMKGICWEVTLPISEQMPLSNGRSSMVVNTNDYSNEQAEISLSQHSVFDLGSGDSLASVVQVDSVGLTPVISGFLDPFARDIVLSCTKSGVIRLWTARVNNTVQRLDWFMTFEINTSVCNPSLVSGTSMRKAALVDAEGTILTIWNTKSAQLEHLETFGENGIIQDLNWLSSGDNQSILAIGFPHRVIIYAQRRYEYLHARPSWVQIQDVRIRDITPHLIGDSIWLGSGNLVIGAGNQLFIQDEYVAATEGLFPDLRAMSRKTAVIDIFTAVSRLNSPLPVYHPQLLSQCVLAGKVSLVQQIVIRLYEKLKFWTEDDPFDGTLGIVADDYSTNKVQEAAISKKGRYSSYTDYSDGFEPEVVTQEITSNLKEVLLNKRVPFLSNHEQSYLANIVECIGMVEKHRRSIDDNAGRFLLFFRQHALDKTSKGPISWREINWAFHSESQGILLDLVSQHFGGQMTWQHAKNCGLSVWLTDLNDLRAQFEKIARNEYTRTEEKNPVDCALYYLALRKKSILVGLWRMATWSNEQGATYRFLSNNFNQDRWKTAALKNAYALMGRRRFEYAASFFLLADHLQDAVSLLHNQLGDTQLAIAVARVYGGDDSSVLANFLNSKILPQAARDGNRWLATWAYWLLNRRDKAILSLVTPLSSSPNASETSNLQSKSYLTDDPALIVLYEQLRRKSLQISQGVGMVGEQQEWDFILHTASLYKRMGCDVLALDLVKTWKFLPSSFPAGSSLGRPSPSPTTRKSQGARGKNSLTASDPSTKGYLENGLTRCTGELKEKEESDQDDGKEEGEKQKKMKESSKSLPTQVREPDSDSILDAFGF